jgi:hypothetical protein
MIACCTVESLFDACGLAELERGCEDVINLVSFPLVVALGSPSQVLYVMMIVVRS